MHAHRRRDLVEEAIARIELPNERLSNLCRDLRNPGVDDRESERLGSGGQALFEMLEHPATIFLPE